MVRNESPETSRCIHDQLVFSKTVRQFIVGKHHQQIALGKLESDTQKNKSKLLPRTRHQSTQDISIFKYEIPNHKTYRRKNRSLSSCSRVWQWISHDTKSTGKAELLWHMLAIPGCMSLLSTKM